MIKCPDPTHKMFMAPTDLYESILPLRGRIVDVYVSTWNFYFRKPCLRFTIMHIARCCRYYKRIIRGKGCSILVNMIDEITTIAILKKR